MAQPKPESPPPDLTREEALRLIEKHARETQSELAARADAGEDVLHYLAENGAELTRRAVAANPGAGAKSNRLLADDREVEVRAELARKIGRLLPGLLGMEKQHHVAMTLATLERLARDQTPRVRAILSEEIKHLDGVPREIALLLARDVESAVACPILEYSPLLSEQDLLEILADAQAREVLSAVARRAQLSPRVADAIATTLDIPSVAALLINTNAQLRKSTLDRIIVEAAQVSELHGPLVLRPELSPGMIRRLAGFIGGSLIEALSRRRDLDEATRAHLARRLEMRLSEPSAESGFSADPRNEVEAALGAGNIDDAFVESAAEQGQRETIVIALAHLGRVKKDIVRQILSSGSAKPLTALVWRAKLSMRTSFKIQTLIMRLKGGEVLPARGGVGFPMAEDDMRFHLAYFNIRD